MQPLSSIQVLDINVQYVYVNFQGKFMIFVPCPLLLLLMHEN
jgi:hypothetical protein